MASLSSQGESPKTKVASVRLLPVIGRSVVGDEICAEVEERPAKCGLAKRWHDRNELGFGRDQVDPDAHSSDELKCGHERRLTAAPCHVPAVGYEPDRGRCQAGSDLGLLGVAVEELMVDQPCRARQRGPRGHGAALIAECGSSSCQLPSLERSVRNAPTRPIGPLAKAGITSERCPGVWTSACASSCEEW